jgi:hypothetical protein
MGSVNPNTAALLNGFWSWVSGILASVFLGVLLPASLALMLSLFVMAVKRRDWREPLGMVVPVGIFAAAGVVLLTRIGPSAPPWDFWLALSLQVGFAVLVLSLVQFLRMARKRLRRDREALESVSGVLETAVPREGHGAEPGPRGKLRAIEAEYYVAEWMRFLGASDAVVTPARRDGGVDVRSRFYVAQVKHRPQDFVSVESVRALVGVAALERRTALFFASGRYSRDCYALAAEAGVALFIFRSHEGRLVAANATAQRLLERGLREAEGRVSALVL